jgi:signal transduction histidine kinase
MADKPEAHSETVGNASRPGAAFGDRQARALVVDDDKVWNDLISAVLRDLGFTVTGTDSASDGIRLAGASTYELALIDYVLMESNGDGLKVAEAVRRASPAAVVIILTGWPNLTLPRVAAGLQVDDLFVKGDLSLDLLRQRVSGALSGQYRRNVGLNVAYLDTVVNENLSVIAHELRSPLVSIKRHAEALREVFGALSREQAQSVDFILAATRRALNLLDAHLASDQVGKRPAAATRSEINVAHLLEEELPGYAAWASNSGIQVTFEPLGERRSARIDPEILRIALNPLVDNALKFSPPDGEVSISLEITDEHVVVAVTDDGPGILTTGTQQTSPAHGHGSVPPSTRAQGSGLGLLIARRAAELHGGELMIKSGEAGGVVATLKLRKHSPTLEK